MFHRQGYDLPAVLLCGAALEEGIRQLCQRCRISDRHGEVLRDIERLNDELVAAQLYSAQEGEQVLAWNTTVKQALECR